ncbi:MAG: CinA family nicotinamide mononucleotide deamidase-related protein [Deltaproteobacteria bacterium]|nr:MAG: CinA family nicotinamide mononucleotide deamidase-related protein [Deltaproteobacteria bacterium]
MSAPIVEFLVTGDEVMRGVIADTNTQITAAKLYPLGLALRRTTVVGDRGEDIRRALLEVSARADFCLVSGGLGPTSDDLTAACAAQAAGVPMRTHEPWLEHLRQRWAKIRPNEKMPANNLRQAEVPETAEVLGNPDGSAPAFALRIDRCLFFFLPGVPREHHRIVDEMVILLQCYGVTESKLDELVSPVREAHPEVRFGFRTKYPENHLSLSSLAPDAATAEGNLSRVERKCREVLSSFVYGQDGATFAQAVGEDVARRGQTICCAESCTGGLLAQLLTEVGGSSRWMVGSFVTYSNGLKESALGVSKELLQQHGSVSEPVVRAMAEGARQRSGATWSTAITGIAGPDGGTPDKPVGTVWLALSGPPGTTARLAKYRGDRGQVRLQSAYGALQLLREALTPGRVP